MPKPRVIGIDHGNANIKTRHYVFPAGYAECGHLPTLGKQDVLSYEGKDYVLVSKRMTQRNDKTICEGHFILSLFAIGMELMHNGMDFMADKNERGAVEVVLAVGLPPEYFKEGAVKFANYLKRSNQPEQTERTKQIGFKLNSIGFRVEIIDVFVFPQAYAAALTKSDELSEFHLVNVVDAGGFTVDCLRLENFNVDMRILKSLPHGMDILFSRINDKVRAKMQKEIPDSTIEGILLQDPKTLTHTSQERINLVLDEAKAFTQDMLLAISRTQLDLMEDTTLFIGGGAILLKRLIEESGLVKKPIFTESVHANAIGYEMIYADRKGGGGR